MSIEATQADKFTEYAAIKEALRPYIEGARSGDGKGMRPMFYDYAHVVGSLNGERVDVDADTFAGIIDAGGSSPDVEHHIAWIDVSGPAAAVKLEFVNWLGNRFTDFFVLYKDGSRWRVSGKVFDAHGNN